MARRASPPILVLALLIAGCGGDDDGDGGDGGAGDGGGGVDSSRPDTGPAVDAGPGCVVALPVDILWVIDNSNSMAQEQNNLAVNFPVLVDVLTSPPDADGDGEPDFPPVTDMRLGVVTTDMGVGSVTGVSSCDSSGDDGALIGTPRTIDPACDGRSFTPPFLSYMEGDDAEALGDDFSCLARLGTGGCGLEQQLEAGLVAVTDRAAAGEPNEGFVREDSLLAVVFVTDEDDCSASDDAIFDPSPSAESMYGPYGRRCADNPDLLHPASRYVDGFRALRPDRDTGHLVVAAIAGVPRDLVDVPELIDYDELLSDDRMQYRPDPEDDTRLEPACEVGGVGSADPARRIVEVVQPFGETGDGVVQSICQPDLSPAVEAIARVIARRLCGPII